MAWDELGSQGTCNVADSHYMVSNLWDALWTHSPPHFEIHPWLQTVFSLCIWKWITCHFHLSSVEPLLPKSKALAIARHWDRRRDGRAKNERSCHLSAIGQIWFVRQQRRHNQCLLNLNSTLWASVFFPHHLRGIMTSTSRSYCGNWTDHEMEIVCKLWSGNVSGI